MMPMESIKEKAPKRDHLKNNEKENKEDLFRLIF